LTTQFAGVIEVEPPLTGPEIAYVRRLRRAHAAATMAWAPARDGTALHPQAGADLEDAVRSLRLLLGTTDRPGRFRGTVAVYDGQRRELLALTVSNGRVTVRSLRRSRARRTNVIDLATRRRSVSRVVG
jgi:hypothetical protein